MPLQFIGDAGVYFPDRDVVKVNALAGDALVECITTRSALEAIGCLPSDSAHQIVAKFEAHRLDCELAAMVKYRRATRKLLTVEITAADLVAAANREHAA